MTTPDASCHLGRLIDGTSHMTSGHDVGLETLGRIEASLGRYNDWLFEQVEPALMGNVLEIGAGIGTFSARLVGRKSIVLTDISDAYLDRLQSMFAEAPNVRVLRWDLNDPAPAEIERGTIDGILCSNVLEHIRNDISALDEMHRLLAPGGRLALLVPAHSALYNSFDIGLEHFRRYSRKPLTTLLESTGFEVEDCWHFNALGAVGWFVNGNILRKKVLPSGQMRIFDAFVPVLRMERSLRLPFGVSLVAMARKRGGAHRNAAEAEPGTAFGLNPPGLSGD